MMQTSIANHLSESFSSIETLQGKTSLSGNENNNEKMTQEKFGL